VDRALQELLHPARTLHTLLGAGRLGVGVLVVVGLGAWLVSICVERLGVVEMSGGVWIR
jgi:hypothetical protein